ncbi:hypothetical protein HHK36_010162 [Tetracentron sinense]|uniref:Phosphatidic acid phosphatase type 2/haloperoxidase domain-containing protein n=1 Tax=Tetracentron sinense TaxID=13715 RepID=A0A834ZKC7_TETSI|nr:hypothetical protein HHK36_010162 [Tetracentron sinense]
MSPTVVSYRSTFRFSPFLPSRLKSLKPNSSFLVSKPVFCSGFISRRPVCDKNRVWGSKTMTELIRIDAFRNSNGDEGVGAIETEALIGNGSSVSRPDNMCGELESTLNRLSKWLVAAFFGVVIIWRHDAEALWAAMGSVVNIVLSVILKQMLNQERPFSTSRSDPGMPSSHAQSIFFAVIFAILSLIEWLGFNGLTVTVGVLAFAVGSYLSWLRVSQRLHTINQVAVGAVVGSIFSILWFWSWDAIVMKAFISTLWVRILVTAAAAGFYLGFLLYLIRHCLVDEQ